MKDTISSATAVYRSADIRTLFSVTLRFLRKRDPRIGDLDPRRDYVRSHIEYLNDMQNITAAEIGVWEGNHAKSLQEQLDISKMYLIDPYDAYEDYEESKSEVKKMEKR